MQYACKILCLTFRGKLWERLALNVHQHLKNPELAIEYILKASKDPELRVGHKIALAQRCEKILNSKQCQNNKSLNKKKQQWEDKAKPILSYLNYKKWPEVFYFFKCNSCYVILKLNFQLVIPGKQLRLETSTGVKSRFVMENDDDVEESAVICSVEELVLAHHK